MRVDLKLSFFDEFVAAQQLYGYFRREGGSSSATGDYGHSVDCDGLGTRRAAAVNRIRVLLSSRCLDLRLRFAARLLFCCSVFVERKT